MAVNKKSFILYTDLIHTVKKLPKETQSDLFMIILEYVNDLNPVIKDNLLLEIAFEPIKLQLKRDLIKWDIFIEKQRQNGLKGGRPPEPKPLAENPNNPSLKVETQKSLTVTDIVTVTDTDSVTETVIDNGSVTELKPKPKDKNNKPKDKDLFATQIFNSCKEKWFELYLAEKNTKPIFDGAEAGSLKYTISKIKSKTTEIGLEWNQENAILGFEATFKAAAKTNWIKDNLELKNINSKFNTIYANGKSKVLDNDFNRKRFAAFEAWLEK